MSALPRIACRTCRALAVTSSSRIASMPGVPTVAESGIPGYEAITRFGFCAPSRSPTETVVLINREINAALKSPEVRDRITVQGMEVLGSSPQEFDQHFRAEVKKWARVVRESRIQTD